MIYQWPQSMIDYYVFGISFSQREKCSSCLQQKEKKKGNRRFVGAHAITGPHLHPIVPYSSSSITFSKARECDEIYTVEWELIPNPSSESVSMSRIAASPLRHSSSRPPISISLFLQGNPSFGL